MRSTLSAVIVVAATLWGTGLPAAPAAAQADEDTAARRGDSANTAPSAADPDALIGDCLESPTTLCALGAALTVTAAEQLSIIRVDALLAIAETFAELAQIDRGIRTAEMARTAAEDIGISIGTAKKLAELAPIWAKLGEDARAVELAQSLSDRYLTANALGSIATAQAREGRIEAAQQTVDRITVPLLALKYALDITQVIANNGADLAAAGKLLEGRLESVDHNLLRGLGYARLALLHARNGNAEKAEALYTQAADTVPYLTIGAQRAQLLASLAQIDLALGDREKYESDVARAATLAGRVRGDFDQLQALSEVAAALAAGGKTDRALELAKSVKGLRGQTDLLKRLSDAPGTGDTVRALAGHILDALDQDEARSERDRARLAVATALSRIGAGEQATEVIAGMEQRDTKARGLAVLARAL